MDIWNERVLKQVDSKPVTFRRAIRDDADSGLLDDLPCLFNELYGQYYLYSSVYAVSGWKKFVYDTDKMLGILLHDDNVIGSLAVMRKNSVAEVCRYAVKPYFHKQGLSSLIGKNMLPEVLNSSFASSYFTRNISYSATTQYATEEGGMVPSGFLPETLTTPNGLSDAVLHTYEPNNSNYIFDVLDIIGDGLRELDKGLNSKYFILDEHLEPTIDTGYLVGYLPKYLSKGALITSKSIPHPKKLSSKSENLFSLISDINGW